jgi:predicted signal transduction protein with EAL and GGDEF domain
MPFRVGDSDLSITASAGAALADGSPASHVWRNAETALARAKAAGGGQVELFGADDDAGAGNPGPEPAQAAATHQPGAA